MTDEAPIRPTKKQRELLDFIQNFIAERGYSPSYREIMSGLKYSSVATVALHVNSLIKRGHLNKRDHSARSLEVVSAKDGQSSGSSSIKAAEAKWLIAHVDAFLKKVEVDKKPSQSQIDELYVLIGALKVLGLEAAAHSFIPRLTRLQKGK